MKSLVIYHGNCADGFTSAAIVRMSEFNLNKSYCATVDYKPGVYGEPVIDCTGYDRVWLLDFSYPRDAMLKIAEQVTDKLIILDHHKTAEEDLKDLEHPKIDLVFDMDKSGAMLTWDYFFPNAEPHLFVKYIQDRDLWTKDLLRPDCDEFTLAVFSYEYDLDKWADILTQSDDIVYKFIEEGRSIKRYYDKNLKELIAACKQESIICGYDVPIANLPYPYCSDAGEMMSRERPFAATYYIDKQGKYRFSLRSQKGADYAIDVSVIAKVFGGGGHANAAGFLIEDMAELNRLDPTWVPWTQPTSATVQLNSFINNEYRNKHDKE